MINFSNKKILFIILALAIIVVFLVILQVFFLNKPTSSIPQAFPTPTPFQSTSGVAPVNPLAGKDNVSTVEPIRVSFPTAISESEKKNVNLSISPTTAGTIQWSEDNKQLTFFPSVQYQPSTTYSVSVISPQSQYSFTFTTINSQILTNDEKAQLQIQADKNTGVWQKNLLQTYPWYNSFPLMTNDYFVYFDPDQRAFIAKIYAHGDQATTENLENQISSAVFAVSPDTKNYPIFFQQQ